jgi:flagellin
VASGHRVERAADDAAGLGVATNLRTAARSARMAARNMGDALAAGAVADGGLREMTDLLQRMRELAIASASETLDDDERAYLAEEFTQLKQQLGIGAAGVTFNGQRLLAPRSADIAVMIDSSNSMNLELPQIRTHLSALRTQLRDAGFDVSLSLVEVSTTADSGDGSRVLVPMGLGDDAFDAALAGFTASGVGLMDPYTVMLDVSGVAPRAGSSTPEDVIFRRSAAEHILLYVSDAPRETAITPVTETETAALLAAAGFTVYTLNTTTWNGVYDEIVTATGGASLPMAPFGSDVLASLTTMANQVIAAASGTTGMRVQAGIGSDASSGIELQFPVDLSVASLGLNDVSVDSATDALDALNALDDALDTVSAAAAGIGASMNRVESALRANEDHTLALSSAESTIRDADFAEETAALTAARLRADAATAALSQARGLHRDTIAALLA